jgi:TonB family protein
LIRRQQRPSEPVATPKQIASKSPQPQETSNRAATADAPDDASSEAEAQKKTEIAKELEVERGRKIQLLLQAQQQSAIEAARERVEPDSTQDRVAPAQITQAPQKPETSTSTLLENPKPAIDSSNTQSVPDNKPASPTDSQSQRGSKVLDATAKPEIRPVLTHIVRPVYPRSFRGRNVDGSVLLSILVSQRGEVEAIRVVHGIAGYPEFTSQAINAVRQWKFRPAIDHGVRVKSWVSCPIVFRRN